MPKEFFLAERQRALTGTATADCRGGCTGCGVCDFEAVQMRLAERAEVPLPSPAPVSPPMEEERSKVRLRLRKDGKARFVSHLEFMTVFHRAVRRAGLPVRFSAGFHPAPRISFPDALPTGVESDAEIIDIDLYRPCGAKEMVEVLNSELPTGFRVLEGATIPWQTPSPSVTIRETVYQVAIPADAPADLAARIAIFLARDAVPVTREKGRQTVSVDLRPDVLDLILEEDALRLHMRRGSPALLAAHLFGLSLPEARDLRIRKTDVVFG